MQAPTFDLLEWLLTNRTKATYNLAFSNISGISFKEFKHMTQFSFPDDFDLGVNMHYGAEELKKTLSTIYHCPQHQIITTTGASEANYIVFQALLNKGDDVIIEQPGYQPLFQTPQMIGANVMFWKRQFEEKFQVNLESLENLFTPKTKLVVMTNLHNPSGVLTNRRTIERIAELVAQHHAYLLVDEIFLNGSFSAQPSAYGLPHVIVTASPTKIYGIGGLHTGWIISPNELAMQFQKIKGQTTVAAPYITELMAATILEKSGHDLVKRFHQIAKNNVSILTHWMNHHTKDFSWVEPDGGIICFLKYSKKVNSKHLCQHLLDHQKLLVNPGIFFNQEGFFRLSYGCDQHVLIQALNALEKGYEAL